MSQRKKSLRSQEERNKLVEKFRFLPRHVLSRLPSYCQRQFGDLDDAEQEGMKALLRASELWDEKQGVAFMTYAFRSIFNRLIHRDCRQRNASINPVALSEISEKTWLNALRRSEQAEALAMALAILNPISRMIIVRRFGLDGEAPERSNRIALVLGISRQAVSSRLRKALRLLKSQLETDYGGNAAIRAAARDGGAGSASAK